MFGLAWHDCFLRINFFHIGGTPGYSISQRDSYSAIISQSNTPIHWKDTVVRCNKTCNNDKYLQIAKKTKGLGLLTQEHMLMALLSFVLYMNGKSYRSVFSASNWENTYFKRA